MKPFSPEGNKSRIEFGLGSGGGEQQSGDIQSQHHKQSHVYPAACSMPLSEPNSVGAMGPTSGDPVNHYAFTFLVFFIFMAL